MESSEESLSPVGVIVGGVSVLEVAIVVGIITGPVARPTVASLLCCTPTQILLHDEKCTSNCEDHS